MTESTRIPKRRGYTVIPNGLLPEGEITARAWGLYAYLLSRPPGWVIHVRQLQKVFKEGRDAIYAAMKQLQEAGLLDMESYKNPGQPPKKRYVLIDPDAILGDPPNPDSQDTVSQDTGNQDTAFQDLNHYLLKPSSNKTTPDKNHPPAASAANRKHLLREVNDFSGDEEKSDGGLHASRQQESKPLSSEEIRSILEEYVEPKAS